jgi:hypothetical protein
MLTGSIVATHVAFDELDDDTASLIRVCRWVLAGYCCCELTISLALLIALQAKWASNVCKTYATYSTSDSVLCELGLPLFALACFGVALLALMSVLGFYAAWSVRRIFVSVYLVLLVSFMMFLMFVLILVVAMDIYFVYFGLPTMLCLLFSVIPAVASVLVLRFKSVDREPPRPYSSMLETVLYDTRAGKDSPASNGSQESLLFGPGNASMTTIPLALVPVAQEREGESHPFSTL